MDLFVFGCGGHARVVSEIIGAEGRWTIAGYVERAPAEARFLGRDVIAEHDFLSAGTAAAVVLAVGENALRRRLRQACGTGYSFPSLVHPSAEISPSCDLGEGSVVMPGAIINAAAAVGRFCVVGSGAVVEHDCRLGDFATLGPRACLCGGCELGEGCYVGAGATVIQGVTLGSWSAAGAGALICARVEPGTLVVGVPARFRREIGRDEALLG